MSIEVNSPVEIEAMRWVVRLYDIEKNKAKPLTDQEVTKMQKAFDAYARYYEKQKQEAKKNGNTRMVGRGTRNNS